MVRRPISLLLTLLLIASACAGSEQPVTPSDDSASASEGEPGNGLDVLTPTTTDATAGDAVDGTTDTEASDNGPEGAEADPERPGATIPDQPDLEPNAIVDRVVDGDTIIVEIAGDRERVRLLGIDTPESVAENRPDQCYGEESADYLRALLPVGTEVTLIRDVEARDQFDRLLAYVVRSSDQLFVNLDLLEQGYAGVLIYEPNSFYRDLFESAEDAAFADDVGLWGVCGGPDVPLD